MAENEYLDASKARRWQSVVQGICEGCSESEIASRILDCLYKTLRQIRRELPLEVLLTSLNEPARLRELCDQLDGAYDVKDFLIEAAHQDTELQGKFSHFLKQSLNNCLYDVPFLVGKSGGNINITEARNIVRATESQLQSEIQRIAGKLAVNPCWIPKRVRPRNNGAAKIDTTAKMLSESLLLGSRK